MTGKEMLRKVLQLMDKNFGIMKEKNEKYGNSFIESIEKYGAIAALTRMGDKFKRLETLILNEDNGEDTDESLTDTALDLANYLYMLVAFKEWDFNDDLFLKEDKEFDEEEKYHWYMYDGDGERLFFVSTSTTGGTFLRREEPCALLHSEFTISEFSELFGSDDLRGFKVIDNNGDLSGTSEPEVYIDEFYPLTPDFETVEFDWNNYTEREKPCSNIELDKEYYWLYDGFDVNKYLNLAINDEDLFLSDYSNELNDVETLFTVSDFIELFEKYGYDEELQKQIFDRIMPSYNEFKPVDPDTMEVVKFDFEEYENNLKSVDEALDELKELLNSFNGVEELSDLSKVEWYWAYDDCEYGRIFLSHCSNSNTIFLSQIEYCSATFSEMKDLLESKDLTITGGEVYTNPKRFSDIYPVDKFTLERIPFNWEEFIDDGKKYYFAVKGEVSEERGIFLNYAEHTNDLFLASQEEVEDDFRTKFTKLEFLELMRDKDFSYKDAKYGLTELDFYPIPVEDIPQVELGIVDDNTVEPTISPDHTHAIKQDNDMILDLINKIKEKEYDLECLEKYYFTACHYAKDLEKQLETLQQNKVSLTNENTYLRNKMFELRCELSGLKRAFDEYNDF